MIPKVVTPWRLWPSAKGKRPPWLDRGLLLATAIDVALVGSSLAAAAGSVEFAGAMIARGQHDPDVNGLKYLAIFAQPRGSAKPAADPTPLPDETPGLDLTPVGSLRAAPTGAGGDYQLVGADGRHAWLRQGSQIFGVGPGDDISGLGRIASIVRRDGRWTLYGEAGEALLSSGAPQGRAAAPARKPFSRGMIFGSEN
jgi:hypothetical protein